jgi:hypothetical protein
MRCSREHDRLAAAQVEPRRRRLQGHRARKAEDVVEGVAQAARVAPQPQPAERGAEHRRVHGDDQPQPDLLVLPDDHSLVVVVRERGGRGRSRPGSNGHSH